MSIRWNNICAVLRQLINEGLDNTELIINNLREQCSITTSKSISSSMSRYYFYNSETKEEYTLFLCYNFKRWHQILRSTGEKNMFKTYDCMNSWIKEQTNHELGDEWTLKVEMLE
jgi:hypothetical protein